MINYSNIWNRVIIVICSIFISLPGRAQNKYYKFDKLGINQGLPNRLGSVRKDFKGYLWFGGPDAGLYKFDGYKSVKYRHNKNQPGSLSNNYVKHIYEDKKNNLWISTIDGLNLFERETESFKVFKHDPANKYSISNSDIEYVFDDKKGNLWIATNNGLNFWDSQSGIFYYYYVNPVKESPKNKITCIAQDSEERLWIATQDRGIYQFEHHSKKFTLYDDPAIDFGNLCIRNLYIDSQDIIWIASRDGAGLVSFNTATLKFRLYSSDGKGTGTNGKIQGQVIKDDERHILISVDQGGINRLDKITQKFEYITYNEADENGLNNNGIWDLYKDNEGILWVLTSGGGINYYNPHNIKFDLFQHNSNNPASLAFNVVGCFCEDHQGMVWVGTDGRGLDLFNPKTGSFKHYTNSIHNPYSISGNTIRCILEDRNNDVWIGTWDRGLNRFDRKTGKFIRYLPDNKNPSSISGRSIWHFMLDHNNILWLAVHNVGVDMFEPSKGVIRHFFPDSKNPNALSSAKVWFVFEDNKQNIWFCTDNGLNLYDSIHQSFKVYKHLPNNTVKAMTQSPDGNLWLGTEGGICSLKSDGTILCSYSETDGLPSDIIHGIVCDKTGNLWISTNNGICNFNPATKQFKNYNKDDGLQDNLFFQESFMKTRSGEIYFGGFKGFNSFHPDSLMPNPHVPPVYITEFQIFNKIVSFKEHKSPLNKTISETKKITLKHWQSVFSFEFTAISFTNPDKNRYAYKMEGFEEEWNYTDANRRYATYTNLNPGNYTFKVKASNNDGLWNEERTSIQIVILPPWWKTWWFRISLIILFFALIYTLYNIRLALYKKRQEELTLLVKQRTTELEQKNTQLIERQVQIEEKTNALFEQTENLQKANDLLIQQKKQIEKQSEELKTSHESLIERQTKILEQAEELQKYSQNLKDANEILTNKQQLIETQTEIMQETNEQLKILNSTKDKFFSIIAHDLRNPFNQVIGFSQLMLDQIDSLPITKIQKYIGLIYSSSISGNNLLENLLQWSRSQTGRLTFNPSDISPAKVASEIISFLEGNALIKEISIKQLIEPNIYVYADENMLKTILRNLVSNAIKFSKGKGIIKIDLIVKSNFAEISVEDNGIGISQEKLSCLFCIDSPLTTKGTSNEAGTGLGLILCKEFVERHNGKIWVESEEGKGSKFIFTLPMH